MTTPYRALLFLITVVNLAAAAQTQGKSDVCPREAKDFTAIQQRAEANDPAAQTALASCYDLGMHVQPDGKESMRWITKAANQGYAAAEYELGRIYLYGRGSPIDYEQALLWERKAAGQGDPRAQRDLAFMYERGFGVSADPAQAAEWNRKAALQGQAAAQLELARKFAQVPDCAQAKHWYKEVVVHGEPVAMHELGMLYLNAKCGADRNQAFVWLTIGGRFGSDESKAEAEKLAHILSPAQKKRDLLIVERWTKQHPDVGKDENDEDKEER